MVAPIIGNRDRMASPAPSAPLKTNIEEQSMRMHGGSPVEELGVRYPVGDRIPDEFKVAVYPDLLERNHIIVRGGQSFGNCGHAFRPEL